MKTDHSEGERKEIGIITISSSFLLLNYGSFFQHWSLRRTLETMGYRTFRVADKDELRYPICALLYRALKNLCLIFRNAWRNEDSAWQEFRSVIVTLRRNIKFYFDYRHMIGRVYDDSGKRNDVDVIIGGDQVWTSASPREYACDFHGNGKKISYAVSADWVRSVSRDTWIHRVCEELRGFNGVSVREGLGRSMLKKILPYRKEVFHAIDPVFLCKEEDYKSLISDGTGNAGSALLYYAVNARNYSELNYDVVKEAARLLNVKLISVVLQGNEKFVPFSAHSILSPREFIRQIVQAKYIVTNSFHGTAFAIIFNKQFVSLEQEEREGAGQNVRSRELLCGLGLSSRHMQAHITGDKLAECLTNHINYFDVNEKIGTWRNQSLGWLKEQLND